MLSTTMTGATHCWHITAFTGDLLSWQTVCVDVLRNEFSSLFSLAAALKREPINNVEKISY